MREAEAEIAALSQTVTEWSDYTAVEPGADAAAFPRLLLPP